ncbi:tripartite tricarboxylate transporter permease [Acetomicrobium sp.]|uniref:tripartite tricarboxylate transporter permease n=1 Tax=Acetomicrobium sp. TaxID=1872099 RepID=UPI002FC66184
MIKASLKASSAGAFGLLIATVGFDTIEGFPRFTFGNVGLYDGVSLVPALIGLFSFSQALRLCLKPDSKNSVPAKPNLIGNALPSWTELHSIRKTLCARLSLELLLEFFLEQGLILPLL